MGVFGSHIKQSGTSDPRQVSQEAKTASALFSAKCTEGKEAPIQESYIYELGI